MKTCPTPDRLAATATPDLPERFAMPGSGCVVHFFATEAEACGWTLRQEALAEERRERICAMCDQVTHEKSWSPEGKPWTARAWYCPLRVWIDTPEWLGVGDAEYKGDTGYIVRLGYPHNDTLIIVPTLLRLDDYLAGLKRRKQAIPHQAEHQGCHRKPPPPPPPPPPPKLGPTSLWQSL
jgi:hypothetical protein